MSITWLKWQLAGSNGAMIGLRLVSLSTDIQSARGYDQVDAGLGRKSEREWGWTDGWQLSLTGQLQSAEAVLPARGLHVTVSVL